MEIFEFAEVVNKSDINSEIASTTSERDVTKGYISSLGGIVSPQTSVKGERWSAYDEILGDSQVFATFQQRRLAVVSSDYDVVATATDRKSKKAAEFIKEMFVNIDFDTICDSLLYAIFYGYSVAECIWDIVEDRVVVKDIKVRQQRRFGFDDYGQLFLKTRSKPQGELMPENKFIVHRFSTLGSTDSYYGYGLAEQLYWPVTFKKSAMKAWITLLDKYGSPTAIGKFPSSASAADKSRLLATIGSLTSSSGIIIPEGIDISLLEPARGGAAGHQEFIALQNEAISKIILSQTMTSDNGSSQSQANVHMQVRQEVVQADAELLASSLTNSLIRWLTEWNFAGASIPELKFIVEPPADLALEAQKIATITNATGYKPTLDYIKSTFGGDWIESSRIN